MIKLIKTDKSIVTDILLQQKISYQVIEHNNIVDLTKNDILFWDMRGFVSYHNINDIVKFLDLGGKIVLAPDENYKIFTRVESTIVDDTWYRFLQIIDTINKKEQIVVLIEGKIYQNNNKIKCTTAQFGYIEHYDTFIGSHYDHCYRKKSNFKKVNYGTAAILKPTRVFREKFFNRIQQTNINISQILMPTTGAKYDRIPDSLHNSYCSIIHETDIDPYVSIISEKTWKPIIIEKFWIALADSNYYNTMKFLGFDIFDDIFDLSFCCETDPDRRVEVFVKELERLNSYDFEKLSIKLHERILENRYNFSRACSIDYYHKLNTVVNLLKNSIEL